MYLVLGDEFGKIITATMAELKLKVSLIEMGKELSVKLIF